MSVLSEAPLDRMLSPNDVAEVLGVSVRTVYEQVLTGENAVPTHKIGRCRRVWMSDLKDWMGRAA